MNPFSSHLKSSKQIFVCDDIGLDIFKNMDVQLEELWMSRRYSVVITNFIHSLQKKPGSYGVLFLPPMNEDKKLNATYIISVARKIGCSIFLLPEDIIEVNSKMILTLMASIMYWSLQQKVEKSESSGDGEESVPSGETDDSLQVDTVTEQTTPIGME